MSAEATNQTNENAREFTPDFIDAEPATLIALYPTDDEAYEAAMEYFDDEPVWLEDYIRWLRDRTLPSEASIEWIIVTTPFLDRHNDRVQFCVRRDGDSFLLTDAGAVFTDLGNSGVPLESQKCQDLMAATAASFGVIVDDPLLAVRATRENFPQKAHSLVQAIQAVDALLLQVCSPAHVMPCAAGVH